MTSDHKSTGDPGGAATKGGGQNGDDQGVVLEKKIEEDLAALEDHDFTEDTGVEGNRTELRPLWHWLVFFGALTLAVFHLWTAFTQILPPLQQRSFHLGMGLALAFLLFPTKPRKVHQHRGAFYGAAMAFTGTLIGYLAVGGFSGGNPAMYLYLPQWAFGALAVIALGSSYGLIRRRGSVAEPSVAQRSAGYTLFVLSALVSLDLVTSDAGGGYFFLPILGVVLLAVTIGLSVALLCFPEALPKVLWTFVTTWGMTILGVLTLVYMATANVTGWNVLAPAFVILLMVQGARYLHWNILGMPAFDVVLAGMGLFAGLYMFMNYQAIVETVGIRNPTYVMVGTIGILLILVAASRVLGPALVVLAGGMLAFAYFGQEMPGFLRHRGASVDQIITNIFVGTEGVFGTPLGISATFIFLFMIFAAMLQRTGMEKFFTDVALGMTGSAVGGTGKVSIITSAFSGTITGSSVANTVSNGVFTIPLMKRSGFSSEYSGGVEAASSTGGQILPPIMGAGAFIMIEFTGASYQQILQAAAIPAIMFFVSQYVVVHYDSKRWGIGGLPKHLLPNVRQVLLTRGYLLIPIIAIFALLTAGYSPMFSAMGAVAATVAVNLVVQLLTIPWERVDGKLRARAVGVAFFLAVRLALPIIVAAVGASVVATLVQFANTTFDLGMDRGVVSLVISVLITLTAMAVALMFKRWKETRNDQLNLHSFMDGLVGAARLAMPIIIACASAGIIAGVITTTDLGLKLSAGLLGVASTVTDGIAYLLTAVATSPLFAWTGAGPDFGAQAVVDLRLDLALVLFMSMVACLVLGIGLPTTANYVITATLAAPAIVMVLEGEFDTRTLSMMLMAHMFVYYYGVLADITPPVCLACYAASGISGGDPIRTSFYAVRVAIAAFIMPYMFVFSPELLLQDVNLVTGTVALISGIVGAILVAMGLVGFLDRYIAWYMRGALILSGLFVVSSNYFTTALGIALAAAIILYERWATKDMEKVEPKPVTHMH
ncbi:TRAP transporter permease [Nocardiopsis oceani]